MVRSAWGRWLVGAVLALAAAGCNEERDLGKKCYLVRRSADGKTTEYVLNRDIRPNQEFISFGSSDCENLICVRDAAFVPENSEPEAQAEGYCSDNCTPQPAGAPLADDRCATGRPGEDDPASPLKLSCRQLLLDAETLAALKESDPEAYERYFGNAQGTTFCARGTGQQSTPSGG